MIGFSVLGVPRPQGSKTYVGKGRMKESSKYVAGWRSDVRDAAMKAMSGRLKLEAGMPVAVFAMFYFERPKTHLKTDGSLGKGKPEQHMSKPDVDKISRAVMDALTGVVYHDDSQVVKLVAAKAYGKESKVVLVVGLDSDPIGSFISCMEELV